MRTTLVVILLALTMNLDVVLGQSTDATANNHHLDRVFGTFAEQDLEAVAASYFERLASPGIRTGLADERGWRGARLSGRANVWASQADQPTPGSGSGNRFGGPLLWAMVIIATTSVGFLYLGIRLSPEETVDPSEE